jgi:threonine dehydrogenase-like Zn-dependent dehydrogenase
MRAIIRQARADSPRLVHDYVKPSPRPDQALIRTSLVGICNTDLEIVRGYLDFEGVLGHEFVGVVEQAEDPALAGQRVVGEINIYCGECHMCLMGFPSHCTGRASLGIRQWDGCLAEYLCLPLENLHAVPDNIPDREAVFVEPLAAACQILEQIQVKPEDRVVVLGDGKLGLLIAQVLALTGCDLTVVGRHQDKLDILAARGIATQTGLQTLARNVDLVVECTGSPDGFRDARSLVRPRGTLVLKSTYHGLVEADLSSLVVDEIQVVGSRCGPFPPALRLLSQGMVDVTPLIEAEYALDDALEAIEHAGQKGTLKVLVRP